MARPKMTAAAAQALANLAWAQAAVQELNRRTGGGAKRLVKLEDGRVVHMRVKNPPPNSHEEIHGCVDNETHIAHEDLKPFPAAGSSSGNLESIGAEHVSSQNVVTPQENRDDGKGEQFKCTACGISVHITQVIAHPLLLVGVCTACYDFLFSSPFTKDNPDEHENECRWCGDGGNVVLCDFCPKAFCKSCIERNCGASLLHAIESPTGRWPCFVCDNRPLQPAILECRNLERLVKRSSPPQKSRRSREGPRWSRCRSIINKTTSPDDTIATIIAREQARLQLESPGKHFTGFAAPIPRRRPKSRPAQHDTNSEHDTSNGGARIRDVHSTSDRARSM